MIIAFSFVVCAFFLYSVINHFPFALYLAWIHAYTLHNITSFELTRCDWFPLIDSNAILRIWQVYVNVHTLEEKKITIAKIAQA